MLSASPHEIHELEPLLLALQEALGVVVLDGKRSLLQQSLAPLMSSYELTSLTHLADSLKKPESDSLRSDVLDVITRCYSNWHLGEATKTVLHKYILGQLPDNARIWVVGCGRGQLAYSVAMEIVNHQRISGESKNIQIIATEVPMVDIEAAEAGIYRNIEVTGLSDEYKRLYMSQNDSDSWQIKEKVRQQVSFKECELTADIQSIGHVDLIICPDVLVYFSSGVKAGVLSQFSSLLNPGGILLTEHNQVHAPAAAGFERVDHPAGVFYRQKS